MHPQRPKKLWFLLACSVLFFAVFIGLTLFFSGRGAYQGAFEKDPIVFSLSSDHTGEQILSENSSRPLSKGENLLLLQNGESESVVFRVYQNGREKGVYSLPGKSEQGIRIDSDGAKLSLLAQTKKKSVAYVSDLASLHSLTKRMEEGGDLVFLSHVDLTDQLLKGAFRLFGDFSFSEFSLESQGKGRIVLFPDKAFKGTFYALAPEAEVYWRHFQHGAAKGELNFYVKAKKANTTRLSPLEYPVSGYEQLSRLASEDQLPRLLNGGKIHIGKEVSLSESLVFSALVKLDVDAPISFNGHTLTFASEKEGVFEVKTAIGTGIDGTSLLFDAPRASLLWTGEGAVPALSTVAKGSNVKSYNGEAMPLGGEGRAIPKLILYGEGVENLPDETVFEAKGNLLIATLPYLVSKNALSGANFALSCEDGTASLEGSISDGVVVTRDSGGKERRYALSLERDPNRIPVVHLETEDGAEITSKTQYQSATFALDGGESEYDSLAETHIRIRGRGNSTWKWEKKPYKIHFDEPTSILGLPAAEEWALFSNYADKSLMRNRLAQVMAAELSFEYCPTQVCVDVFLNGEYLGVYTLGEHLESGEGRVEVDYDMSRTDCGYFLEAGGVVAGVDVKGMNYFHAGLVNFVLIKTPDYNQLTSEQFEYIHQYMLRTDEAIKKGEGYEEYIDVDSVVDWLIMIELSCNTDCTWRRSTYFTKDPGGKLVMGPMWDFDLAFGNFSKDNPGDDTWVSSEPDDDYVGETWSTHLLEDPEFQARFKARWLEVRDTLVNTAMEEIERQYALNSPSAELNFKRWDILGKKVAFERHDTKDYLTYSSQIYYLQDFILNRAAWLDEQVANF